MPKDSYIKLLGDYIDDHPHFYLDTISPSDNELTFIIYKDQHPLNTPTNTHRTLQQDTAVITWHDNLGAWNDKEAYIIAPHIYSGAAPMLPADVTKIKEELPGILDELSTYFSLAQFRAFRGQNNRVPKATQQNLHEQFSTYYNALKASPEELRAVDGMGERRIEYFLDPPETVRSKPQWAALTHCPECSEEFWSAVFEGYRPDETDITIDTIQTRTYCPVCDHNRIPASHIMEPVEFSDENILKSFSTSPHRD